jgi:hypothetical protein
MSTATLKVSRKWAGLVSRNREWQVLIDGDTAGSIAVHQTLELPVEPGHHTLRVVQSHRHLSPQRSFDLAEGQRADFWCRGAVLWPVYLAALVKPDLWITLKTE